MTLDVLAIEKGVVYMLKKCQSELLAICPVGTVRGGGSTATLKVRCVLATAACFGAVGSDSDMKSSFSSFSIRPEFIASQDPEFLQS